MTKSCSDNEGGVVTHEQQHHVSGQHDRQSRCCMSTSISLNSAPSSFPHIPYSERLLDTIDLCTPPALQNLINTHDHRVIETLTRRIVEVGTPDECRRWLRSCSAASEEDEKKIPVSDIVKTFKVGALPYGCLPEPVPMAIAPSASASRGGQEESSTLHTTWAAILDQLGTICDVMHSFVKASETYIVPSRIQAQLLPVLYAWLTDFEFFTESVEHWRKVSSCFQLLCVRDRVVDCTLAWKPLVELLLSVMKQLSEGSGRYERFSSVGDESGSELQGLCECASNHFGKHSLEEIWGALSPHFSRSGQRSWLYLAIFCNLIPSHQLCDPETGCAIPAVYDIVNFLFRESYGWQDRRDTWVVYSFKVIARMVIRNEGLLNLDEYAEPIFSSILFLLQLPIGSSTARPAAKTTVPQEFNCLSLFAVGRSEMIGAMSCVAKLLTNDTESPMWRQYRRLLHTTSVFVRPGSSSRTATDAVCSLYNAVVSTMHHRIQRQTRYIRHVALVKAQKGSALWVRRPIPAEHIWTRDTINSFVELTIPVVIPSLHVRHAGVSRMIGHVLALAPGVVMPVLQKYVDSALQGPSEVDEQRAYILRILHTSAYALLTSEDTSDYFKEYLRSMMPVMTTWLCPSTLVVTGNVVQLFATVATTRLSFVELFGGQDGECEVFSTFFDRIIDLCQNDSAHAVPDKLLDGAQMVLHALSEETFQYVVDKCIKECGAHSSGRTLLRLLVRCGPRSGAKLMQLAKTKAVPNILNPTANDAITSWSALLLNSCIIGSSRRNVLEEIETIKSCIHALTSHITSNRRLHDAISIYMNTINTLKNYVCTDAKTKDSKQSSPAPEEAMDDEGVDRSDLPCVLEAYHAVDAHLVSRERLLGDMGLCRSTDVHLDWDEPQSEHVECLMQMCEEFIADILYVVEHIEQVKPIPNKCRSGGLRALVSSLSAGKPLNDEGNAEEVEEDSSESAEEFTPHNVLVGCCAWLKLVFSVNAFLFDDDTLDKTAESFSPTSTTTMELFGSEMTVSWCPYWYVVQHAHIGLPKPAGRTLAYSREGLFGFVKEHMLRRTVGNVRHQLTTCFGPSVCDDALDLSVLESGRPPLLQGDKAEQGDVKALVVVMSTLNLISGLLPMKLQTSNGSTLAMTIESNYIEPVQQAEYFPLCYWKSRATHIVKNHSVMNRRKGSLSCCRDVLNISHLLRFLSVNTMLVAICNTALRFLTCMMLNPLRRVMYACHLEALQHMALRWLSSTEGDAELFLRGIAFPPLQHQNNQQPPQETDNGTPLLLSPPSDDDAAAAAAFADEMADDGDGAPDDEQDDGADALLSGVSSTSARDLVQGGLHFALSFFTNSRSYYEADVLFRVLQTLMWYPEPLVTPLVRRDLRNLRRVVSQMAPQPSALIHAWLVEELLALAARLLTFSPLRAFNCVRIALSIYHPMDKAVGKTLSLKSVQALFRLSVSNYSRLQQVSFVFIKGFLENVQPPSPEMHVMLCESPSTSATPSPESIAFFKQRYTQLKAAFPFLDLGGTCEQFIPHDIVIPSNTLSEGFFGAEDRASIHPLPHRQINTTAYRSYLPAKDYDSTTAWRDHLAHLTGMSANLNNVDALRQTWLWRMLASLTEQYDTHHGLHRNYWKVWRNLGLTTGPEQAVRLYMRVVSLQMEEFAEIFNRSQQASKESAHGRFVVIMDLHVAMVSLAKEPSVSAMLRHDTLDAFASTALYTCGGLLPSKISQVVVPSFNSLTGAITSAELWYLCERFIQAFDSLIESSSQERNRVLTMLVQLVFIAPAETHGELLPKLLDTVLQRERSFFMSTTTLTRRFAASVLRQITRMSLTNSSILPLSDTLVEQTQQFAMTLISRAESLCFHSHSNSDNDDDDDDDDDDDCIAPLRLPSGQPRNEQWSATPALPTASCSLPPELLPLPTPSLMPVAFPPPISGAISMTATPLVQTSMTYRDSGPVPSPTPFMVPPTSPLPFVLDAACSPLFATQLSADHLSMLKVVVLSWYNPPVSLLETCAVPFIKFLARALDATLPSVDDFPEVVGSTTMSLAWMRMPKTVVHDMIGILCDILRNKTSFGRSRRSKMALARMLCTLFFVNTHRIGKYSMMQNVAEAALNLLGHGDGRLRAEGKTLLAVLTRVSSIDQTRSMVAHFERELHSMSVTADTTTTTTPTASPISMTTVSSSNSNNNNGGGNANGGGTNMELRRRRIALVLALCATLAADPGAVPPYTPKLMERLEPLSRDPNAEIRKAVKTTFEEWWRSHREGWDLEYRQHFTVDQLDTMAALLKAPTYYV